MVPTEGLSSPEENSGGHFADLQALEFLLSAAVGIGDELESARLVATGLPAIIDCEFAAIALEDPKQTSWSLKASGVGGELSTEQIDALLSDMPHLRDRATVAGRLTLPSAGEEIPSALSDLGIESLGAFPIRTAAGCVGVLLIGRSGRGANRAREMENSLLAALATPLALGIENQRLRATLEDTVERRTDQLRRRADELDRANRETRQLLDLTNAVVGTTERSTLFDEISSALGAFVSHDRSALLLYRGEIDSLEVYALSGSLASSVQSVGRTIPRDESNAWTALDRGQPVIVEDLAAEAVTDFQKLLAEESVRSMLIVPLIAKKLPLGVLAVAAEEPAAYTRVDADRLSRVAAQVAIAVEKLIAFEEIKQLKGQLEHENVYLREEIRLEHDFEEIVGASDAIVEVERAIQTVAPTDASVLISGETGTGKELIARALHNLSKRRDRALVKINCAAIPAGLVESELFGHERGAFTGALSRKIGRFQLANHGTIFLDEIGELPLDLQSKLLRVLQGGEFERLGSTETKIVDVRVIAATNRDLGQEISDGRFRSDLYYRLNVFPIEVPPVRERGDDIRLLVRHFAEKFSRGLDRDVNSIPRATMDRLAAYDWPGNVRELRNVIERAVILSPGETLELGPWFQSITTKAIGGRSILLNDVQRDHILQILEIADWKVSGPGGAAELLGLKPTTLNHRMQTLGIERPRS